MMAGHGLMWSNIYQPEKPHVKRRVDWKRMGALFAPYWRQQATVLGCIVVVSALGLVPGFVTAHIIDSAIPRRDVVALGIDVGIILVSALLAAGIGVLQGYLNSLVGEGIMRDLRTSLVAHLHRMPLQFFTGTKTGEIMNRVSND
ncbi:MAG TPA: ABC transporter transmembrane domain-containing protein, partial [Xanthobacteraceae bacterium]